MLIRWLGAGAVAALCGATLVQLVRPSLPRLLYNPSPSAPIGWYRVEPVRPVVRDELVAAFAPPEAAAMAIYRRYLPPDVPLIKTVWAVAGDRVCHDNQRVTVRNRPPLVVLATTLSAALCRRRTGVMSLPEARSFWFPPMCRPHSIAAISGRSRSPTCSARCAISAVGVAGATA